MRVRLSRWAIPREGGPLAPVDDPESAPVCLASGSSRSNNRASR